MDRAREWLEAILDRRAKIDQLRAEIDRLRQSINLLPGVSYDGDLVQTSTQDSAVLKKVEELTDKERQLADMVAEYETEVAARVKAIHALTGEEYTTVLYERYVRGRYWWEIARKLKTSESTVYRIHREALELMEEVLT